MNSRKSMKLPVIITFIIIGVIVFLFTRIKQTEVVCEKTYSFDLGISLKEKVVATLNGKEIDKLYVTKTIILPEKYIKDEDYVNGLKNSLDKTLNYLGDKVVYSVLDDRIIIEISVKNNEVVLLKNIKFEDKNIIIDSNTKSSDVVTLTVGDDYTDGEFMKTLKGLGYSCK
ncbi:MAG: hypothetical protein IK137_02880 [Bacilli bacterium]|nr:hypothetical protein [Bacilli bacterium]